LYFTLARKVRAKDTEKGVEQEKGLFYSSKNNKSQGYKRRCEAREVVFYYSKKSKSQGYKRRRGARERLILFYLEK
jgi:hypothetical protein